MRCLDIDIITLKSFVAVVDLNGFRKAASYLNISQPALSRRIARLEEEFGVTLFERDNNHIRITAAGLTILQTARKVISDMEITLSSVREEMSAGSDSMTISCISSLAFSVLPKVISGYKKKFKHARIAIQDRTTLLGMQAVREGSVDFAIIIYHDDPNESELDYKLVHEDDYLLICSRHHPLASAGVLRLRDLQNHDVVLLDRSTTNYKIITNTLAKHGVAINPACEVTHVATAIEFAANNLGISFIPKSCLTSYDKVMVLPVVDLHMKRSIVVATKIGKTLGHHQLIFIDMLREHLATRA
jgi:DNA-binding transcriptional LysR family regulator